LFCSITDLGYSQPGCILSPNWNRKWIKTWTFKAVLVLCG